MAKKQRYVYLQLYPKDLLADEKLVKCDKESAWAAYFALLNILSLERIRGCLRLRDWDNQPNNERHSLVANFRKANSLRTKAAAFGRIVAQCTPMKAKKMAEGIEQLLEKGVVVLHDDALIQPRMFRDSHSMLEGYDPWPDDNYIAPPEYTSKMVNTTSKDTPSAQNAHARTLIEYGNENESERSNNIDSIGNKGGVGENGNGTPTFDTFWTLYDKKRTAEGALIDTVKCREAWDTLTADQQREAIAFLPAYIKATPVKKYRMAPANYLSQRAWLTIEIDEGKAVNRKDGTRSVPSGLPAKDENETKTPLNNPDGQGEGQKSGFKREKDADGTITPPATQKHADSPANVKIGQNSDTATVPVASASGDTPSDAHTDKRNVQGRMAVVDQPPTLREIQDYMQSRGEGGDPFRHITAEQFYDEGCMSGWTIRGGQPLYDWRARLRSLEGYRRKNGEPAVTEEGFVAYRDGKLIGTLAVRTNNNKGYEGSRNNQRDTARSQGGHTEGDDGMLQQSVRIISRLRASREAEGSDGTDSGSDPF